MPACLDRGTSPAADTLSRIFLMHLQTRKNAMTLKSFATVAFILIPSLAYAAGGGGTGISNAGNGGPSGANSDASNANTPVGPASSASDRAAGKSGSSGASGTGDTDAPAMMGASKEMKRQNGQPQKAP
jgi:hypothetical protein